MTDLTDLIHTGGYASDGLPTDPVLTRVALSFQVQYAAVGVDLELRDVPGGFDDDEDPSMEVAKSLGLPTALQAQRLQDAKREVGANSWADTLLCDLAAVVECAARGAPFLPEKLDDLAAAAIRWSVAVRARGESPEGT